MKIEQRININAHHVFADASVLYVSSYSHGMVGIFSFNPHSLKMISEFAFYYDANPLIPPCVDESCIYLPSNDGQIIGVDKFSGDTTVSIDLGLMTQLSDIQQSNTHVYVLCGIPITNRNKIDVSNICITANDKKSGKKQFQTRSFSSPIQFSVNGNIWVVDNKTLLKLSDNFDVEHRTSISFNPNFAPLVTDDYVILCSNKGLVEVLDHDLHSIVRLVTGSTSSVGPILCGDIVLWFVHGKLLSIDPETRWSETILKYEFITRSSGFTSGSNIYTTTSTGNFVKIHTQTGHLNEVHIIDQPLDNPTVVDDMAFVNAEGQLHQICLNAS